MFAANWQWLDFSMQPPLVQQSTSTAILTLTKQSVECNHSFGIHVPISPFNSFFLPENCPVRWCSTRPSARISWWFPLVFPAFPAREPVRLGSVNHMCLGHCAHDTHNARQINHRTTNNNHTLYHVLRWQSSRACGETRQSTTAPAWSGDAARLPWPYPNEAVHWVVENERQAVQASNQIWALPRTPQGCWPTLPRTTEGCWSKFWESMHLA